jgi:2-polyprenyl-6-methoxyphenol hydroxylase-like FAD-dependent oxidoreductase
MKTAIVIGGSMMGFFAAKVLAQYAEQVIIIERDSYPDEPKPRNGTPQARHGHILLGAGQKALDQFFPELRGDIQAAGIKTIMWGRDTALLAGDWLKRVETDILTFACSRLWLEWAIRRRIVTVPNIQILADTHCTGLLTTADKTVITGVTIEQKRGGTPQELPADLVVDCSGRESKLSEWFTALGYAMPPEEVIDAYVGYATRWYKEPANFQADWLILATFPRPEQGIKRSAGILRVEDGQWSVIANGANRDYPPTDEAGFLEFLQGLPTPKIAEYIQQAEPISPIYGYRNTANRLRHYEKMSRRPANVIAMGDAVCSFNPSYGQGLSVVGIEAGVLDTMLKNGEYAPDFAAQFQQRIYSAIGDAWLMATGGDLVYPETTGPRPGLVAQLVQTYINKMTTIVTPHDTQAAETFFRVMQMDKRPSALLNPLFMLKTLQYSFFQPA